MNDQAAVAAMSKHALPMKTRFLRFPEQTRLPSCGRQSTRYETVITMILDHVKVRLPLAQQTRIGHDDFAER